MRFASGTALAMRAWVSSDVMKVHRMLAHPSKDITRKTAEMMGIEATGQWGASETCFQAEAKRHAARTRKLVERQAVKWVDGPKRTGGDGTGNDDRGIKSAGDGNIVERGTPQLNVQELGQGQQMTLHEHETQEAFGTGSDDRGMKSAGDKTIVERGTPQLNVQELGREQQLMLHEHETQETFLEHEGETQWALSELEEETQAALSEHERDQQIRRGKRDLHRGREIWRDRLYPPCVSLPSTAISRPYCHHVRGVDDPTPVWREKRCIVPCRRSKPRRQTA